MIGRKQIIELWQRLNDVIQNITLECECDEGSHTIPVDVKRDWVRINISESEFGNVKTDGNLPRISRIILSTHLISGKKIEFLGMEVVDNNGNSISGGYRQMGVVLNFLSTDWYDLFGKDIAWEMAEKVEGLLLSRVNGQNNGIWDEYLEDNGAALLRKDYTKLFEGMIRHWGIENIYQVSLAFHLTDRREWTRTDTTPEQGGPIDDILFEVTEV